MTRDVEIDPHYHKRRESTSQALLLDQLDIEDDYKVEPGYSEQQRFINIRPISFYYCLKYTPLDLFAPYLAMNYHDRFLSKNIDIPVVMQGEGFERNLELFVFSCVIIACRELYQRNFNFHDFVDTFKLADERDVRKMEFQIREGLEGRVTAPPTAFHPMIMGPLISLLEMEDQQLNVLVHYVMRTLFTINEDIEFTKFLPSTLMASAILVACFRLYPVLYPMLSKKILRSGYVEECNVQECFDELKDHIIVDGIFSPHKCPLLSRENVTREQGKKLLIDDPPKPNSNQQIKNILKDYENFIDGFRAERQNQEHTEQEEEVENQEDRSEIKREEETEEEHEDTSQTTKQEEHEENESDRITEQEEEQVYTSEITEVEEEGEEELEETEIATVESESGLEPKEED